MKRHKLKPKKQYYIYVHCRPDGEPFYVGKGQNNRNNREFILVKSKGNKHYHNVVDRYGKENILIYTLNCVSEQQAHAHEIWMIAWCRAQGHRLTNMTDGGEGTSGATFNLGRKHTRSVKEKRSRALKDAWKNGRYLGMLNKKHSAVAKLKIGAASIARNSAAIARAGVTEETGQKISASNKGKHNFPKSPEVRAKISASQKARLNKNKTQI